MVPMYLDTFAFIFTCFYSQLASAIKILEIMKFVFGLLHGVVKRSAVLEKDDHEPVSN